MGVLFVCSVGFQCGVITQTIAHAGNHSGNDGRRKNYCAGIRIDKKYIYIWWKPAVTVDRNVMKLQDPYDQVVKPWIVFPFSLTFAHGNKKIFCSFCK
ncbi:hypothetical protein SAMN04487894_110106 [Niabella drilacis]|uniref:Uncharacterized protein n=2 Tax=Niabella drilacis (strain DSM 25811 / CCM 8410 / CCUG 62505 / LMG 26954 / E90) TaxID=1285928 RepID=A0A1G6VQ14_NIADE|nr:hypothetical protein SAMN04487894_110106 [Niabella drilacis]